MRPRLVETDTEPAIREAPSAAAARRRGTSPASAMACSFSIQMRAGCMTQKEQVRHRDISLGVPSKCSL